MGKRPILVTIISALLLLNGILTIVNTLRFDANPTFLGLGAFAVILSLGLWQLWSWAWWGTILLQLVALGFAFYDWFTGGPIDYLAIFIGVGVILYMLQAGTRAAFSLVGEPAEARE